MKNLKPIVLLIFILNTFTACFEDQDDTAISTNDINDFVWKAMNYAYLYKDNIPNLADNAFATNNAYQEYLLSFSSPETLFESLIYDRENVDRFSWMVNDYIALEEYLQGTSKSNGLEFYKKEHPQDASKIYIVIRSVAVNSPASALNLQRGQIITAINSTSLTNNNLSDLLNQDTYTLHFATYNTNNTETPEDDTITETNETATISKTTFTENPIQQNLVLEVDNKNIGYLVYSGFTSNFDTSLTAAFSNFSSENIDELVLDLRYNPGGSVSTATLLASLITGQFSGEIFSNLNYNNDLSSNNKSYTFSEENLPSLQLNRVYVLTTYSTASASEMIINSLNPYIEVIQIGTTTRGKSQASVTLYDSPDFSKNDVNPLHNYALQPLVAITTNKLEASVPASGLVPTIELEEIPYMLGVLGETNEPLLAAALQHIADNTKIAYPLKTNTQTAKRNTIAEKTAIMHID